MKVRIGSYNDKYWVEGKFIMRWRGLPTVERYLHYIDIGLKNYAISKPDMAYYDSYEKADEAARKWLMHFASKRLAVYSRVR